ncbi:MAG: hypothetical protein AAF004_03735 [Pseudomonadota bacterium]
MPVAEIWYRNTAWSADIADHFFDKLAGARSSRDQYLAIQALTLCKNEPEVTLDLANIFFDSRNSDFEVCRVLFARGQAFETLRQPEYAREAYEAGLVFIDNARSEGRHLSDWGVRSALPLLIVRARMEQHYERALELCANSTAGLIFPAARFLHYGCRGLLLIALGQPDAGFDSIAIAYAAAAEDDSGLQYHRGAGLVDEKYAWLLDRLDEAKNMMPACD